MKSALLVLSVIFLHSCHVGNTVEGNANIKKEQREISGFTGITVAGPFQVTVQQSSTYAVTVEADENLMKYIVITENGTSLEISEKNGYNLRGTRGLRVTVQLPEIDHFTIAGSGTINTPSAIKNSGKLKLTIGGSGKIDAIVDAPEIDVEIGGSGTASLSGQTRKMDVSIGGSGDCLSENLKSEDCNVSIGGSGLAKVFASSNLSVNIGGSGDVYYSGKPANVQKSVAGSGKVKEL